MRIVRLTEPSDLESLFRFRHEVYVGQLGWLPPDPSGLIRDDFDAIAYNYAAYDDTGRIVGSMRVVPDSALGLPLERYAPLNGYRDGKTAVELCRLAVHRDIKSPSLGALLMKTGFERAELAGASHVVLDVAVQEGSVHLYEKMGFVRVGHEYVDTYHDGQMLSVTMSQAVRDVYDIWPQERPGLHRFFTARKECIDHG